MQFLIIAYDAKRRTGGGEIHWRDEHIALSDKLLMCGKRFFEAD